MESEEARARVRLGHVRDPRLSALFLRRPVVERILAEARASGVEINLSKPRSGERDRDRGTPFSLGSGRPPRGGPA